MGDQGTHPKSAHAFDRLDFLYMPSRDVARDLALYVEVLGGDVVFAIEAMGTRVAEVKLSEGGPRLLLADHLEGESPVLVHRVADLDRTVEVLEQRGLSLDAQFGIPHGPCATFHTPGGQRSAIYELTRPEADAHFAGRFDFEPGDAGAGSPEAESS